MLTSLVTKVFGNKHERDVKKLAPLVDEINSYSEEFQSLNEETLIHKTVEFKERLEQGDGEGALAEFQAAVHPKAHPTRHSKVYEYSVC